MGGVGGRLSSVPLQEETAIALCGFLSVPLTCRGSSNSKEVSRQFRVRGWQDGSGKDEAKLLVPNPTRAAGSG